MYLGQVLEEAGAAAVFESPRHPYTEALLASIPVIDREEERLRAIRGTVPAIFELPPGCRFAPRCDYVRPPCEQAVPELISVGPGHRAACIRNTGYVFPEDAA